MPSTSFLSAWYSQVQGAVNRDEITSLPAFARSTSEPVDIEALTLAIRVGKPDLVKFLLPLIKDHSPQAAHQIFIAWSSRRAEHSSRLSISGNLEVFRCLLSSGFLPSLELTGKAIFETALPFAPHPANVGWSSYEQSLWREFSDLQRFWLTHVLPQMSLNNFSSLKTLTTDFFPCLVNNVDQTVQFFMELQAHQPRVFPRTKIKFARSFALQLWQNFFSSPLFAGSDSNLRYKFLYQSLNNFFPCPATFSYAPTDPQYGTYATPYQVAPITFAALSSFPWAVNWLISSQGQLPALLTDVDRLAPEFIKNNLPDTWFYPYLDPAKIDLFTPPSPSRPPLLFNLFSCREIKVNPVLHQFLVTNLEACQRVLFNSTLPDAKDNFLTHWQCLKSSEPQVRLLDANYQSQETLSLSNYATRLYKESLEPRLPLASGSPLSSHL